MFPLHGTTTDERALELTSIVNAMMAPAFPGGPVRGQYAMTEAEVNQIAALTVPVGWTMYLIPMGNGWRFQYAKNDG